MKIGPLGDAFRFFGVLKDRDGGQAGYQRQQKHKDREEAARDEAAAELSPELLSEAVEAFAADGSARQNGLEASVSGTGLALKVTLKDGTGAVVRQFSGEEFLRLRQAASADGRTRGKILDQKL